MPVKLIEIKLTQPIVDAARVIAGLDRAMLKVITDGERLMATYPGQVLNKTGYRRTGTLKRSWSFEKRSGGGRIEGIVGSSSNIAPYNEAVQGAKGKQRRIFKGAGWKGLEDLAKSMEKDLVKEAQAAVEKAVR